MKLETQQEPDSLKRVFTLPALIIYGVGDILGAGIYAVIGDVAELSGYFIWASFLTAASVAALTALSYAELGGRLPRSGGVAYFIHYTFRAEWLSLIVGWSMFCTCVVSMATTSKAFAGYLNEFLPAIPPWAIILAFFAVLAFFNFRGMEESSALNILCTCVEVSGLLIVIILALAFLFGGGDSSAATASGTIADGKEIAGIAIIQGAALAFYSFIGFEDIVNVSEEVKNPERNVPRAILMALSIAGGIYMLVSWLATRVLSPDALASSNAPLAAVVQQAQPNFPAIVFSIVALFAVLNTALLNFVTASRLLFGMAKEGLLPTWLAKLHRKRATPYRTILVILPIVIVLAFAFERKFLAGTTATLILLMFCCVNLSLLVIKKREGVRMGFQVPIIIPALALLTNLILIFFASTVSQQMAAALIGIGLLLIWLRNSLKN
jgi:basic amino acid/polyamine antiporter, APA family